MSATHAGQYGPKAIQTSTGRALGNLVVDVYQGGTTNGATIYADPTKTSTIASLSTSAAGNLTFWATPGSYTLSFLLPTGTKTRLAIEVEPWFVDTLIPTGTLMATASATVPPGWLEAAGQAVSRATYPALFAALGGTSSPYGHTTLTFNVPDCRGRTILGAGTVGTVGQPTNARGAAGGTAYVVLTTTTIPAHHHTGSTGINTTTHTHNTATVSALKVSSSTLGLQGGGVSPASFGPSTTGPTLTNHVHAFTTATTGKGSSHQNMMPYITLMWIIKA